MSIAEYESIEWHAGSAEMRQDAAGPSSKSSGGRLSRLSSRQTRTWPPGAPHASPPRPRAYGRRSVTGFHCAGRCSATCVRSRSTAEELLSHGDYARDPVAPDRSGSGGRGYRLTQRPSWVTTSSNSARVTMPSATARWAAHVAAAATLAASGLYRAPPATQSARGRPRVRRCRSAAGCECGTSRLAGKS